MKKNSSVSFSRKAGRVFGRAKHGWIQQEKSLITWAAKQGAPVAVVEGLLWVVKFVVLAALLYGAFWITVMVGLIAVAIWGYWSSDWDQTDEDEPEWRNGDVGYGLYTREGHRIDLHIREDDDS